MYLATNGKAGGADGAGAVAVVTVMAARDRSSPVVHSRAPQSLMVRPR